MEDLHGETLLRGVVVTLDADSAEAGVLQSPLERGLTGTVIVIVQNGRSVSTMIVDYSDAAVTRALFIFPPQMKLTG